MKIFNKVPIKEVVKCAAPKTMPHQAETRFDHSVAPVLNKRLRGSQTQPDVVAERSIPATSGYQTLVVLLGMLYVRCDGVGVTSGQEPV